MNRTVTQRPRARLDLLEQFVYFGEQASVDLAERYLAAVEQTCLQLARNPQMGSEYVSRLAGLQGVRRFPVDEFEHYLIFYLPQPNGIDVLRVLHAARDIEELLAQEEG